MCRRMAIRFLASSSRQRTKLAGEKPGADEKALRLERLSLSIADLLYDEIDATNCEKVCADKTSFAFVALYSLNYRSVICDRKRITSGFRHVFF